MKTYILAAALAGSFLALPATAQENRVELGLLDCVIEGGAGFVFGSSKDLSCVFTPADDRPAESYFGVVNKFGLDVGVTGPTVMQWLVLAPTSDPYGPGALAGDYVGVSAEATAAVGVGANVLVGGSDQTFTLQPVSVQAQTGLNLAVGVSEFQLRTTLD